MFSWCCGPPQPIEDLVAGLQAPGLFYFEDEKSERRPEAPQDPRTKRRNVGARWVYSGVGCLRLSASLLLKGNLGRFNNPCISEEMHGLLNFPSTSISRARKPTPMKWKKRLLRFVGAFYEGWDDEEIEGEAEGEDDAHDFHAERDGEGENSDAE
jgi:hypothetical protein